MRFILSLRLMFATFRSMLSMIRVQLSQLTLFQLTEFQLTEFQLTLFQLTLFQLTEFQLTLLQLIGFTPVHSNWLVEMLALVLCVVEPLTAA